MIPEMQHPDLHVCVLAAGRGKRMRSSTPKVLHKVLGRAMIDYVLHTVEELRPCAIAIVTGHGSRQVRAHVGQPRNLEWVVQDRQLGTGHAIRQCENVIQDVRDVLIVCGDTPLLRSETLARLVAAHRQRDAAVTVLTAEVDDPRGYGRILRDAEGNVQAVIEEKDASDDQKQIREVSSGIYCVQRDVLFTLLHKLDNRNAQGEYYLPDIVPHAVKAGLAVAAERMADAGEMAGINDREQLARVEDAMQRRIIRDWQISGVTIEKPETVRIEATVSIGTDTLIRAGCHLLGSTRIGDECRIGPYAVLEDTWLDDQVEVAAFSHLQGGSVGMYARIGPFARLRPGTELDEEVHIGNFVEIKNAIINRGSKVNHLSYIGDTEMGEYCNVGAGTITCNYDGANKHKTIIGDRVFIGSDTKLIAPVHIKSDATVGAGSIITKDVEEGGLTLSERTSQRYISGWKRPRKGKR